jgi:hypothetical protein
LIYDPEKRGTTLSLMNHSYFTHDGFHVRFETELSQLVDIEREKMRLLKETNEKNRKKKLDEARKVTVDVISFF